MNITLTAWVSEPFRRDLEHLIAERSETVPSMGTVGTRVMTVIPGQVKLLDLQKLFGKHHCVAVYSSRDHALLVMGIVERQTVTSLNRIKRRYAPALVH